MAPRPRAAARPPRAVSPRRPAVLLRRLRLRACAGCRRAPLGRRPSSRLTRVETGGSAVVTRTPPRAPEATARRGVCRSDRCAASECSWGGGHAVGMKVGQRAGSSKDGHARVLHWSGGEQWQRVMVHSSRRTGGYRSSPACPRLHGYRQRRPLPAGASLRPLLASPGKPSSGSTTAALHSSSGRPRSSNLSWRGRRAGLHSYVYMDSNFALCEVASSVGNLLLLMLNSGRRYFAVFPLYFLLEKLVYAKSLSQMRDQGDHSRYMCITNCETNRILLISTTRPTCRADHFAGKFYYFFAA